MKKIMLSLTIACAGVCAAFAETWFGNAISQDLTSGFGTWTRDVSGWTWNSTAGAIDYKNMDADLTFTVATPQTLPGDEATVNTSVKFTAMAMEDFVELTNDNSFAWSTAKGGLTIIEEPENSYKFYGIVDGDWVALGNTMTSIPAEAVDVEIKIWENNGRKISYKVAKGQTTYLDSGIQVAAVVGEDTINGISYRGNCQIASLTGSRENEMWEITLKDLLEAVATLKVGETSHTLTPEEKQVGKVSIQATKTDKIWISYAPASADWKFFAKSGDDKSGKDSAESAQVNVSGDQEINVVPADYNYAKVIAKIGDASYQSLADAFLSASGTTKQTIDVVSTPTDEALEMTKNVALDAGSLTVAANFTLDEDTTLEILGGNYTGLFTEGKVSFNGVASFTQIESDVAKMYCAAGYFAKEAGEGCEIVKGEEPTKDVPFSYDPAVVPQGTDAKTFFNQTADNNLSYKVNYLLGMDPNSSEKPEFESVGADQTILTVGTLVSGNPGTGWTMQMSGQEINLSEAAKTGKAVVKIQLTKDGEDPIDAFEKTIGVLSTSVTDTEDADFQMVSVPYAGISNEGTQTLDQAINKANLADGDEVMVYDTEKMSYLRWVLNANHEWVYQAQNMAKAANDDVSAETYEVKPGQGLWVKSAQNFYQYGAAVDSYEPTVCAKDQWNLIANPAGVTAPIVVSKISGATVGDVIRVENKTGAPTEYAYTGSGKTGWQVFVPAEYEKKEIIRGTAKIEIDVVKTPARFDDVESIGQTGFGTWYIPSENSKTGATIAW